MKASKKILLSCILALAWILPSRAQISTLNLDLLRRNLGEVSIVAVDSLTREPVQWGSFYMIPAKDTTITKFALTDSLGRATAKDVPFGEYDFYLEMMGYLTYHTRKYLRREEMTLDTLRLRQDPNFLEAATVTGIGNAVMMVGDTLVYNASSFRVGSNDMLRDLLKTMPGIEVSEGGQVTLNGEPISRITVGGRTFFFDDPTMAINNIPAKIVDKIKFADKRSNEEKMTGMADGAKEKVMDVELKEEFRNGWFGNVSLAGGAGSKQKEELGKDRPDGLYSASGLLSGYTTKDQLTVIGNASNVNPNQMVVISLDSGSSSVSTEETSPSSMGGISENWKLGANLNTTRLGKMESSISATVGGNDNTDADITRRTTFLEGGDLLTSSSSTTVHNTDNFNASAEIKNEKNNKYYFYFHPYVSHIYGKKTSFTEESSTMDGLFMNSSTSSSVGHATQNDVGADLNVSIQLPGKRRRTLALSSKAKISDIDGKRITTSLSKTATTDRNVDLLYDQDISGSYLFGSLSYTESLSERFKVQLLGEFSRTKSDSDIPARDRLATSTSDLGEYYSTISNSTKLLSEERLALQYSKGTRSLQAGLSLVGEQDETYSKAYLVETTTGGDDWNWHLAPYIMYRNMAGGKYFYVNVSGNSVTPSTLQKSPSIDPRNLSRLSLGNIYLKDPFNYRLFGAFNLTNTKKFSSFYAYFSASITTNPVVYARWYSPEGILSSLSVNGRRPNANLVASFSYTTPINKKKTLNLDIHTNLTSTISSFYESTRYRERLDAETLDYNAFMSEVWGDSSGSTFYKGGSGFRRAGVSYYSPSLGADLNYRNEGGLSLGAGASISGNFSHYGGTNSIDNNTGGLSGNIDAGYVTKNDWDFDTKLSATRYLGYSDSFDNSEFRWDASISKDIKAFTLSLSVYDILNQAQTHTWTGSENYTLERVRLRMGRYFLFGIKWNFGKMSAAHASKAQNASIRLSL